MKKKLLLLDFFTDTIKNWNSVCSFTYPFLYMYTTISLPQTHTHTRARIYTRTQLKLNTQSVINTAAMSFYLPFSFFLQHSYCKQSGCQTPCARGGGHQPTVNPPLLVLFSARVAETLLVDGLFVCYRLCRERHKQRQTNKKQEKRVDANGSR